MKGLRLLLQLNRVKKLNLISFLEKYGTETSNNLQLLHWAKQLNIKNFYVLMRDEIKETAPINFKKPLNIITNNNTSDENGVLFIKRMRTSLTLFHRNFD